MAEVTNELLYEVLKSIQSRLDRMDFKLDEVKQELQALRTHHVALQQDVHNIYGILARHDDRLDRIERRLDLAAAH
jgi:predicted nuclease with TOPRIM domain